MAQTPLQQLERLIGALSELVSQEHALLTEQTWEEAAALELWCHAVQYGSIGRGEEAEAEGGGRPRARIMVCPLRG